MPMHTGSCAQKLPFTPSTLIGLLPVGHFPFDEIVVITVVDVDAGAVVTVVGVWVVAVGA